MPAFLAPVVAWIVAHPVQVVLLALVVLSVVNGALPAAVRAGPLGRGLHVVVDRLAFLVRREAFGTLKWPGIGSVLLHELVRPTNPPPPPASGPTLPPPPAVLAAIALVMFIGACFPLPPPDGCRAGTTRCGPSGHAEACSPEGRWSRPPLAASCPAIGAVCCLTRDVYAGADLHACVPDPTHCLAAPDAGGDAAADGGVR